MMAPLARLPQLLLWEFRLQWRYFFWLVGLVVTSVWALVLISLSTAAKLTWLPVLIFADICNIGLLFIAGSLILDRQQGTLDAISVLPFRTGTWLLGKLISLTVLCSACSLVLIYFHIESVRWVPVLGAVLISSAFFTSLGFILACPFRNVLNYFLVMALATTVLSLPLLDYLGVVSSPLFWLIPSQPVIFLLGGSLQQAGFIDMSVALLAALGWIALFHYLGVGCYHRYVTPRAGG